MTKRKSRLLALVVAMVATLAPTSAVAAAGDTVVGTDSGAVRGTVRADVAQFLGIPYAAPQVGGLQWQPPQPTRAWPGVRDATKTAPACAQPPNPFGRPSTSEDCLHLNADTPSRRSAGQRFPVMVSTTR